MTFEFNTTISGSNLQKLEFSNLLENVSNINGNFNKFWYFVRGLMSKRKNAALVFRPEIPKDIGGYFVHYSNCEFVVIAKKNLVDGKLNFDSLEEITVFVHELCHWLHSHYFENMYTSGNPLAGKLSRYYERRADKHFYDELEAWNLSRKFAKLYNFSEDIKNAIDIGNAKNMYFVLSSDNNLDKPLIEGEERIKKDYNELTYEDFVLDENGKFSLPLLESPIKD